MCAAVIPNGSEKPALISEKSGFFGYRPQNDDLRQIVLSKSEQLPTREGASQNQGAGLEIAETLRLLRR